MMGRMATRFVLAITILIALFVSAVRLPASACPVSSPPAGEACEQGSCPNKACCAAAQKNKSLPSLPLAKDDSTTQQLVGLVTSAIPLVLTPAAPQAGRNVSYLQSMAVCATPTRALLCTFLI